MTSLCRRLASNGLFRLSINRHTEKESSGGKAETEKSSKGGPSPKISFLAGLFTPLCGEYAAAHYRTSENKRGRLTRTAPRSRRGTANYGALLTITVVRSKGRREG
jgi:hypothetical protein